MKAGAAAAIGSAYPRDLAAENEELRRRIQTMEKRGAVLEASLAASRNFVSVFKKRFEDASEKVVALEAAAERAVVAEEALGRKSEAVAGDIEYLKRKYADRAAALDELLEAAAEEVSIARRDCSDYMGRAMAVSISKKKLEDASEKVVALEAAAEKGVAAREEVDSLQQEVAVLRQDSWRSWRM